MSSGDSKPGKLLDTSGLLGYRGLLVSAVSCVPGMLYHNCKVTPFSEIAQTDTCYKNEAMIEVIVDKIDRVCKACPVNFNKII